MTAPDVELVPPPDDLHPALAAWLDDIPALIAGLARLLPAGTRLDLSRESLTGLNAFALARFPDKRAVQADDPPSRDLAIRMTAYLGEALLHVGGGYWDYVTDQRSPFRDRLVVYPAWDAFPVSPLSLMTAACARRADDLFTTPYDTLRRELAERRAADPGWRPQRVVTPGYPPLPGAAGS